MTTVTMIGLGPMGRAMASALLGDGHRVTVFNRTPEKADALVEAGAVRAPTPGAAIAASDLVFLSLTDYPAMYQMLDGHTAALAGKVLVNLSSDTPEASREAAAWAEKHGAAFVTGGVMVPAEMIGLPGAYVFLSGPPEPVTRFDAELRLIGEPRYLGADPGLAQLFYQAHLEVFLTSLSALLHATALVTAAGAPAEAFLPDALTTLTDVPAMVGDGVTLARRLESGDHPGDASTAMMMGATADHIVRTSERAGVDPALPRAVKEQYDRAIAAGHGGDDWTSLYEILKSRR